MRCEWRHRDAAHEALYSRAEAPELAEIAGRLGHALRETSDDDALWADLAASASRVQALSVPDRDRLARIVNLDWSLLLSQLGYRPPPPARVLSDDLREAMSDLLSGGTDLNPAEIAGRVRSLADELIVLSGTSAPSKSRLLKALRKGVRVSGQLLVPAAAGAIGAAVVIVLPHLGIPIAVAIAHHAAATTILEAGAQSAISEGADLVKGGALRWFKKNQDRQAREVGSLEPGATEDAADRAAFDPIRAIRPDEIGVLSSNYEIASLTRKNEPGGCEDDPERIAKQQQFQDLLADADRRTADLVSQSARALYYCWDAATGAEWATQQFHALAQDVADSLAAIRELLSARRSRARTADAEGVR